VHFPTYSTTNSTLARQNILFAVVVGMITPREAERMMKRIDKLPKYKVQLAKPKCDGVEVPHFEWMP
jgi:hypothetical protein